MVSALLAQLLVWFLAGAFGKDGFMFLKVRAVASWEHRYKLCLGAGRIQSEILTFRAIAGASPLPSGGQGNNAAAS